MEHGRLVIKELYEEVIEILFEKDYDECSPQELDDAAGHFSFSKQKIFVLLISIMEYVH